MRFWMLVSASLLALPAHADFDPAGPSVDWTGQIVTQSHHNEDTCFTLQRTGHPADNSQPVQFVACSFGWFGGSDYQTGHWLEVKGILQPDLFDHLPQVAGAGLYPTIDPAVRRQMMEDPAFWPPPPFMPYWYYPGPYYPSAPFYNPWFW